MKESMLTNNSFFTSPNGFALRPEGHIIGKRHDNRMFNERSLVECLEAKMEVGLQFYAMHMETKVIAASGTSKLPFVSLHVLKKLPATQR